MSELLLGTITSLIINIKIKTVKNREFKCKIEENQRK